MAGSGSPARVLAELDAGALGSSAGSGALGFSAGVLDCSAGALGSSAIALDPSTGAFSGFSADAFASSLGGLSLGGLSLGGFSPAMDLASGDASAAGASLFCGVRLPRRLASSARRCCSSARPFLGVPSAPFCGLAPSAAPGEVGAPDAVGDVSVSAALGDVALSGALDGEVTASGPLGGDVTAASLGGAVSLGACVAPLGVLGIGVAASCAWADSVAGAGAGVFSELFSGASSGVFSGAISFPGVVSFSGALSGAVSGADAVAWVWPALGGVPVIMSGISLGVAGSDLRSGSSAAGVCSP